MIWALIAIPYVVVGAPTAWAAARYDTYDDLDPVELTLIIVLWPLVWAACVIGVILTVPGMLIKKLTK